MFLRQLAHVLVAGALFSSGCLVSPTNPYDEDAPAELQVKGLITGRAAFPSVQGEAPRPPEGIRVVAERAESDEALEITTKAADGGAFSFEVVPGNWFVRAEHPAFSPASVGPIRVSPAIEVPIDTLVLRLPEATSSLAGRVVAEGGLSAQGVEVSLLHALSATTCGPLEAKTTTDASGAFTFAAIRPGSYVVVARTEGATIDVLAGDEVVTIPADTDATLPRDLVVEPGSTVVELEADGVRPAATTKSPALVVHLRALPGMSEMQLGGDPTFDPSLGATGWRPLQTQTAFTLPPFDGEHTVFVQMRSACASSPLYAARVLYDESPPELLSVQVGTTIVSPLDLSPPLVVAGAAQAGLPVTLNVVDESGVASVHLLLTEAGGVTTQVEATEPEAGQSVVRVTANIPVDEGAYPLTILVEDRAGNITPAELAPEVLVLRDVSAPSTPLPSAPRLEVTGASAIVWLEERECDDGTRAPVCEVNPHEDGLYRIRGGALVDFTPFAAPPFELQLGGGAETTFEILAIDAAGYTSPGVARVDVVREVPRTVFTAPLNKELGGWKQPTAFWRSDVGFVDQGPGEPSSFYDVPTLTATNGTAFVSLRAKAGSFAPYFGYLIAQPAELSDVGTRWSTSPLPAAIRKLNFACSTTYECYDVYSRAAGGLGAASGALTWLERIGFESWTSPQRPMRYVLHSDADGRYDIRGPETDLKTQYYFDHEDVPAPASYKWEECRTKGPARCAEDPWSWAPLHQPVPSETAFDGRRLVTSAAAQRVVRLVGSDEGDVQITGPRVLATVIEPLPGFGLRGPPLIGAIGLRIGVPAGTVLYGAFYTHYDSSYSNDEWNVASFQSSTWVAAHVASGSGTEVMLAPHGFRSYDEPVAVGVMIPEGVTATVPRLGDLPDAFPFRARGLIDRPYTTGQEAADLDAEGAAFVDDETRALDLSLFLAERDNSAHGNLAGLSLYDLGADLAPARTAAKLQHLSADPTLAALMQGERHGQLATVTSTDDVVYTAAADAALAVPTEGCAIVVRPKADVHIRSLSLEGRGDLDDLTARIWERGPATSIGRYDPAFVNPTSSYSAVEYLSPLTGGYCSDVPPTLLASDTVSGSIDVQVSTTDSQSISSEPPLPSFSRSDYAGEVPNNAVVQIELDAPNGFSLPVTPGKRVAVTTNGTYGDIDLIVRWNAAPTKSSYHCYPWAIGSDEVCDLTAPGTATSVYVAVATDSGYGPADYTMTVEVYDVAGMKQIGSWAVNAGDVVRSSVTVTAGDPDLYVRLGDWPTTSTYSARSATYGDELVSYTVPSTGTAYVAIDEYELPASYDVLTEILTAGISEVGSYQVGPAQEVRVTTTSTTVVDARVRFDDAGEWQTMSCSGPAGARLCKKTVPGSSTLATVGVTATQVADYDATVDVYQIGCDAVQAGDPAYGGTYDFAGILRAGRHYLITVGGSSSYAYVRDWPTSAPAIYVGSAAANEYLDVLGNVTELTPTYLDGDGRLIIGRIEAGTPTCRLALGVTPSIHLVRPALGEASAAAVQRVRRSDGAISSSIVAARTATLEARDDVAPAVVRALAPGWEVAALGYHGDDLLWLEHDASGRRAALWRSNAKVFPPAQPCQAHAFPSDARVTAADLDDGRLIAALERAGRRTLELFDVVDDQGCGSAVEASAQALASLPVAIALDGNDAFLWQEGTSEDGGQLQYVSLREVAPLWSGSKERVLGFDARGDDAAFTLYDGLSHDGRMVLVTTDASSGALSSARVLVSDGARLHPRFVASGIASVKPGTANLSGERRPMVALRPLAEGGGAEMTLASSSGYFAGAAPLNYDDPAPWAEEIYLEASGELLAVLGHDDDGVRRLALWRVPADSTSWWSLAPEHEARLELAGADPEVERLSVSASLVVVTFNDGNLPVVLRRPAAGASWEELAVGGLDEERLLGVYDDDLLLMRYPGNLYADRPPVHVEVFVRDSATLLPATGEAVEVIARLPAETYVRPFSFVGRGVDGALAFYDQTAALPVLWRVDENGFAVRDDGGHRPLTLGVELGGPTGSVRSSGEALYFLRRQDAGVSLMRYRSPR